MKQRRPIAERPAEVEGRETTGHWEADFMLFAKSGQGLLFLHERQTCFNIVHRPTDRKAARTAKTIARQLGKLPKPMRKSISFDDGNELAEHHRLHQSIGLKSFFCDPHSPWQKGGVENSIGRLRRHSRSQAHAHRLNTPHAKCLNFKTPAEAFSKLKSTVALQT
ncbi:IS30 family transposase [Bradyrhizobium sp. BR 1433]|uniref:IS30 family transposase n=1 Tax=Bradyrhizobium sp. BR 1433 TaxID=3447967 RepID=UPI003EE5D867